MKAHHPPPPDGMAGVSLRFVAPLTIQTYDVDMVGIVSNVTYVRWLENLRMDLLRAYWPMAEWWERGITPILARTDIRYRLPLPFGAAVFGGLGVAELHHGKWVMAGVFFDAGKVFCEARQEGYFVDAQTLKPMAIPAPFRELFERHRLGEPPATRE